MRDIAEAIGRRLKLPVKSIAPEEAQAYFGWLAMFAALDMPASSEQTRKKLGWEPTGPKSDRRSRKIARLRSLKSARTIGRAARSGRIREMRPRNASHEHGRRLPFRSREPG